MESNLTTLLAACRTSSNGLELVGDDVQVIANALSPPIDSHDRAHAYVILNRALRGNSEQDVSNLKAEASAAAILNFIRARLPTANEQDIVNGLSLLASLFHIQGNLAAEIFVLDSTLEDISDVLDLYPQQTSPAAAVSRAVAALLSQASGHKNCRDAISSHFSPWLEKILQNHSADPDLRAAAISTSMKLASLVASNSITGVSNSSPRIDLFPQIRSLVLSADTPISLGEALEALVYASNDVSVQEDISKDRDLLVTLFAIVPEHRNSAPAELPSSVFYGIAVIIMNVIRYQPRFSQQEDELEKLRRLASRGLSKQDMRPEIDALEDDEHVQRRVDRLVSAGCLGCLNRLGKLADGIPTREAIGRAYLSIVENKNHRGLVLQSGGSKMLLSLINRLRLDFEVKERAVLGSMSTSIKEELIPIQALAKLTITSAPVQVFGPDGGAALDAVRPLAYMFRSEDSSLLQRFEALMALTNLATLSETVADRISETDELLDKLEFFLLHDHEMIRRAAVELLCNLVGSTQQAFARFGGESQSMTSSLQSKVHLLIALSDVEDVPTRSAASAILAMLSSSPGVAAAIVALQIQHQRAVPILLGLLIIEHNVAQIPSENTTNTHDIGLFLRGVTCIRNILAALASGEQCKTFASDAITEGLKERLAHGLEVFGTSNISLRNPIIDILKMLKDLDL